jgi:hypothetical protein
MLIADCRLLFVGDRFGGVEPLPRVGLEFLPALRTAI